MIERSYSLLAIPRAFMCFKINSWPLEVIDDERLKLETFFEGKIIAGMYNVNNGMECSNCFIIYCEVFFIVNKWL